MNFIKKSDEEAIFQEIEIKKINDFSQSDKELDSGSVKEWMEDIRYHAF